MRSINTIAIIAIIFLFGTLAVIAQPASGSSGGQGAEGLPRRRPTYPDIFRQSTDMVATGNYRLRCRGGNGLSFQTVNNRADVTGFTISTVELTFSPSAKAAGEGLQPGECALIERAFYLDEVGQVREPVRVRFETPANAQLRQQQNGSPVDRSPTAAESYPDAMTIPVYMQSANNYWTFNVTNSGKGFFSASSNSIYKSPVSETTMPKGNRGILVRN